MALKKNENKVKFGLKRVAFAIATIAEDGTATYGDVISFPGARTLSMEPQGAGEPWYADDGVYYFSSAPASRQGDLEMARIIDAFKRQVLGYIADANGILLEDMNPAEVHFALLFETMNDKRPRRYVLYNCMATAPTVGSATNEGSKEPQTETSTIISTGIYVPSHGKWFDHGETTPKTDPEAYANWFNAVQTPGPPPAPYPIKTVSGNPVIITDGADNMSLEDMTVEITLAQSGSGDPAPDNVRPISAWTGATIRRTGKNYMTLTLEGIKAANTSGTWDGNAYTVTGVTHTILTDTDGTVTGIRVSGTPTGSRTLFKLCDYMAAFDAVLSGCPAGGSANDYELQYNGVKRDFGSGASIAGDGTTGSVYIIIRPGYTASDLLFTPMIRPASITDSAFEPYQGQTYEIDWASEAVAITSGTLLPLAGRLNPISVLFETTWGAGESATVEGDVTNKLFALPSGFSPFDRPACNVCTHARTYDTFSEPHFMLTNDGGTPKALVAMPNNTSADQVIQISYTPEMLMPVLLTPVNVRTLLGINVIVTDCGESILSYHSDPSFDDE